MLDQEEIEDICDVGCNGDVSNCYNPKKPTWWKRVAGRRGSKSQRRSILNMTEAGYVLPTKIGRLDHELSMSKLFQPDSLGTSLKVNDILIPKSSGFNAPTFQGVVNIELGFGLGDNLLTLAMKYPDQYYLGAEIHSPGVGTALGRVEEAIKSNSYWLEQTWFDDKDNEAFNSRQKLQTLNHKPYENVRFFPGDGIKLLSSLPDQSIDSIYLTFPDPFPKESDVDFRVIQEETVSNFARVLKRGGYFYLATDAPSFDEWTVQVFNRVMKKDNRNHLEGESGWQVVSPCPDRHLWLPVVSKYEEKGILEGRCTMCRCWRYL
jgi:tRNA G46 methylase TrmB